MFRGPERDNSFDDRIHKFKESVERSAKKYETLNEKLLRLNSMNKRLSEGFSVSMHVIVDISNLLKQYTSLFDDMENLLNKMDDKNDLKTIDIQYMNAVTKKTIEQLTADFSKQIDNIVNVYEKNGKTREDMVNLNKLKHLSNNITNADVSNTVNTTTPRYSLFTRGGNKKNVNRYIKKK